MGLFDLFRRDAPIDTLAGLDDFLDNQAAFLVQKCIYEYCRARAGVLAAKLFKEPSFVAALDRSRWSNYPICLGHVAQMVADTLRHEGHDAVAVTDALVASVGRVTNRYPIPGGMREEFWADARSHIEERLRHASLAGPRPVKDIPMDDYQAFFDQLPIHESLRGFDYQLVRNNLRINLCRAYETLVARADLPALAKALTAASLPVVLPHVGRAAS